MQTLWRRVSGCFCRVLPRGWRGSAQTPALPRPSCRAADPHRLPACTPQGLGCCLAAAPPVSPGLCQHHLCDMVRERLGTGHMGVNPLSSFPTPTHSFLLSSFPEPFNAFLSYVLFILNYSSIFLPLLFLCRFKGKGEGREGSGDSR